MTAVTLNGAHLLINQWSHEVGVRKKARPRDSSDELHRVKQLSVSVKTGLFKFLAVYFML